VINGSTESRYKGNLNISFAYVEGESLLMAPSPAPPPAARPAASPGTRLRDALQALKDMAVSSGSACTSASLEPSYVLRALGADGRERWSSTGRATPPSSRPSPAAAVGVDEEMAHTSIRFGIGRFTTEAEVDYAVENCVKHVERLREMSPLWEMVQEGIDLKSIQWSQH